MINRRISIAATLTLTMLALLPLSIPTSAQIDNCCFVDRQCTTNYDWVSGYYAFQNNHCAAPSQQQQQLRRNQAAASEINNCCFIGWQCDADEEWRGG